MATKVTYRLNLLYLTNYLGCIGCWISTRQVRGKTNSLESTQIKMIIWGSGNLYKKNKIYWQDRDAYKARHCLG